MCTKTYPDSILDLKDRSVFRYSPDFANKDACLEKKQISFFGYVFESDTKSVVRK